jgi:predicted DNA-binding transcriptional regulator AlpA
MHLLTAKETAALLRVGVAQLYRLQAAGVIPQAIRLGPQSVRWDEEELVESLKFRAGRGSSGKCPKKREPAAAVRP